MRALVLVTRNALVSGGKDLLGVPTHLRSIGASIGQRVGLAIERAPTRWPPTSAQGAGPPRTDSDVT